MASSVAVADGPGNTGRRGAEGRRAVAQVDRAGRRNLGNPGSYIYQREVPAAQLAGEKVVVNFELDKALRRGGADVRELEIIVLGAALESK